MSKRKRTKRGSVGRGVSLYPALDDAVRVRGEQLGLGFSAYVVRLIEHDLRNIVLTPISQEVKP